MKNHQKSPFLEGKKRSFLTPPPKKGRFGPFFGGVQKSDPPENSPILMRRGGVTPHFGGAKIKSGFGPFFVKNGRFLIRFFVQNGQKRVKK